MRRMVSVLICGTSIVSFSVLALLGAQSVISSPAATPSMMPGPSDEDALLQDVLTFHSVITDVSPSDLSFGTYTTITFMSEDFYTGVLTENLASGIITLDEWAVPVLLDGTIAAAARIRQTGPVTETRFYVSEVHDQDFGEDLDALSSGSVLLADAADGAWYVISGETASPFNYDASMIFTGTVSLDDFQKYFHSEWLIGSSQPPGLLRGGGAVNPESGRPIRDDDRLGVVLTVVLAVLAAAVWAVKRSR